MHRRAFLIGSLGLAATTVARPASATTRARAVRARTLDELRTAIAAAKPGADIVLANGTYDVPGDQTIAVNGKHGTSDAPITVRAESVGGVTLTGNHGFVFANSSYVVISGFTLRQQTTFEVPTTCQHIRISRNDIQLGDIEGRHWVMVTGDATVVERNHFHGKSTLGVFLGVEGPGSDGMASGVADRTELLLRPHLRR
jgi:poly(beta-D-mannuronate) lyase